MNSNELFEQLDNLRREIGNIEDITKEKKRIIGKNIKASLRAIEVPDFYYGARERVVLMVQIIVIALFISALFIASYATSRGMDAVTVVAIGIIPIIIFAMKMPSIEDLTEKISRSDNDILRKIFIPQKIEPKSSFFIVWPYSCKYNIKICNCSPIHNGH